MTRENALARAHRRLGALPAGPRLFSLAFRRIVPYAGSVRPQIRELGPGRCVATMEDRRAVRNHLDSIHAVALTNLAEMTTGLALNFALPAEARSIMTRIEIDFVKKARGRITATSEAPVVTEVPPERVAHGVPSTLTDASGEVVARAVVTWLVGAGTKAAGAAGIAADAAATKAAGAAGIAADAAARGRP